MIEDHDDFAFEPVPGLPENLPKGETMLWQGSPDWRNLAISAFHVRKVAAYFLALIVWRLASATGDAATVSVLLPSALRLLAVAGISCGILCGLAYLYARSTIYTLTTKRIVIRSGVALPITLNIPLALIETASLASNGAKGGSIALTVVRPNRIAYVALWPNARPLHVNHPQPMLRALSDADAPARMLAKALELESGGSRAAAGAASLAASSERVASGMPAGSRMAF